MTEAARLFRKAADLGNTQAAFNLALMYDNGAGVARDQRKAAELILAAIKMQHALSQGEGRFVSWSEEFRKELQHLLKEAGTYNGPIDGEANEALERAVEVFAARSRG
jgi:TPR repeat protein